MLGQVGRCEFIWILDGLPSKYGYHNFLGSSVYRTIKCKMFDLFSIIATGDITFSWWWEENIKRKVKSYEGLLLYEPTIATKSPNILVLVADDFGYNDVSWNNPEMFTPELEKLARDGVILDTFYSQPRCSPSRASLLTGLYPFRMGIQRGNVSPFRPSGLSTQFKLLPQILKTKGYSTHLIGKHF